MSMTFTTSADMKCWSLLHQGESVCTNSIGFVYTDTDLLAVCISLKKKRKKKYYYQDVSERGNCTYVVMNFITVKIKFS